MNLIDKIKANREAGRGRPATDSDARIILGKDEAINAETMRLRWANSSYSEPDKPTMEIGAFSEYPKEEKIEAAQWEITLTDSRLIVWSPLAVNLLHMMSQKRGAASGGHVLYDWIDDIILDNDRGRPELRLEFSASPKEKGIYARYVYLIFNTLEDGAHFYEAMADRLSKFWNNENVTTALDALRTYDWTTMPIEKISLLNEGAKVIYIPR